MVARFLALFVSVAAADADADPHEFSFRLTKGNRQSLAIAMDGEQSWVVTGLGDGQAQESGVVVGDRLLSANGESSERKGNYWLMTHIEARPLDLVFRHGSKADQDCEEEQLLRAYEYIEKGEVVNLRRLLEDFKCNVNQAIEDKPPLMHLAAAQGKIAPIKILSFYGGKLNQEFEGSRPLHVASEKGHTFAAHVLAEQGADFDAKDANGLTAFHLACFHGHTEILKVLWKFKCDWLATTADGKTTYEVAQEGGHESIITLLDLMIEQKTEKDKEDFDSVLKGAEL